MSFANNSLRNTSLANGGFNKKWKQNCIHKIGTHLYFKINNTAFKIALSWSSSKPGEDHDINDDGGDGVMKTTMTDNHDSINILNSYR